MLVLSTLAALAAPADEAAPDAPDPTDSPAAPDESETVVVEQGEREVSAAEVQLDRGDIEAAPGRSADDLLKQTRGLHQSAHSGHGKAYQYFLRGFDAVHGADLAIDLEGVPINEVSNVHGHGYLDLHFLPRELIEGAVLRPGVHTAEAGDFAVAGSGSLALGMTEQGLHMSIGGTTTRGGQVAMGYHPKNRGTGTFVYADGMAGRGVGESRGFTSLRAAAGLDGEVGRTELRVFALAYRGRFESPGVLRQDQIDSGEVGFYDAYDGSGNGLSMRAVAAASATTRTSDWRSRTTVWTQLRRLELRQNFTGAYENPENGDGTLQAHDAASGGVRWDAAWRPGKPFSLRFGADARVDRIQQQEAGITDDYTVWEERIDAGVVQSSAGAWIAAPMEAGPLRVEPGIRAQAFNVQLDRTLDAGLGTGKATATAPVLGPRLNVALQLGPDVALLGGAGRGFRSPEARGVEQDSAPVSVADGAELGAKVFATDWLELRLGGFGTWVSNEIRFDHAAARFLTTGSTRRLGGFGGFTARIADVASFEVDVTGSDGRYTVSQAPIPYAPRWLVVGSLTTQQLVTGPLVWTTGVRTWWLSERPIPGGYSSHAATVTDLTATARHRNVSFDLDIGNVFATRWRDGEFFYASTWGQDASDPPALPARHITAGSPFDLRFAVGVTL
jgi:hypothetical protein